MHSLRIANIRHDSANSSAVAEGGVAKDPEAVFRLFGKGCDESAVPLRSG